MICARCHGAMYRAPAKERGARAIWLWACLCGERMDQTIWLHRQMRRPERIGERHDRIMRELRLLCAAGEVA